MTTNAAGPVPAPTWEVGWLTRHHKACLWLFTAVVIAHWAEHLVQAAQIYILGWPIPEAGGLLGYFYPWLVTSEVMHYGFAVVMLAGLYMLRNGFHGRARQFWMLSFAIQFWHHIEHLLLLIQSTIDRNLAGSPVPMSVLQFLIPRVELHLFYNTIVTIPMVVGMVLGAKQATQESRPGLRVD